MTTLRTVVAVAVGLVLLGGCEGPVPPPSPSEGMAPDVPPVALSTSINAVMVGLVDHAAHHIWDVGLSDMAPESDHEWEEVTHHAIQLMAGGSYITIAGTGDLDANWVAQPGWQAYAQDLANAGAAAFEASMMRDLDGVLAAGDSLIVSCEGCHADYKPALPTEGILHPHAN